MQKKIRTVLKRRQKRSREPESRMNQAIESLPRITNETVAEHREEMLGSARKFIYPLRQTRRRVIVTSSILLVVLVVAFFAYTVLSLYKFQSTSAFMYRITQVLPFPVARAGGNFVAYENYLFELRHYIHYYQTQQQINFDNTSGKDQLNTFRKQALQQVIDATYVRQLAEKNNVSVSDREVSDAVGLLRQQNRLGGSDQEFADVLREFWGWSIDDFRRELKQQLLAQKVVATLDTNANTRAQQALTQIKQGQKFADVAKQFSDDASTKDKGGEYPFFIEHSNRDLSPQIVDQLYKLQPGQTSGIINTGYALEIIQVISNDNDKIRAAHIACNFQPISTYLTPSERDHPAHTYIHPK